MQLILKLQLHSYLLVYSHLLDHNHRYNWTAHSVIRMRTVEMTNYEYSNEKLLVQICLQQDFRSTKTMVMLKKLINKHK